MRLTWLIENKLAASGMPWPEDVPTLASVGVRAVLSLTERTPFPEGVPDGIEHCHLPVPDMTAPTRATLDRAVSFLVEHVDGDGGVLVHCGAGLGRTGTVLAAYFVAQGRSADEAIRRVREARPGSIETFEQENSIHAYGEALRNE